MGLWHDKHLVGPGAFVVTLRVCHIVAEQGHITQDLALVADRALQIGGMILVTLSYRLPFHGFSCTASRLSSLERHQLASVTRE